MSKDSPVPRLDLAPKLKRPLSLWNPLDYLRLLYWVFYFPQALQWYLIYCRDSQDITKPNENIINNWIEFTKKIIKTDFFIQGITLSFILNLSIRFVSSLFLFVPLNLDKVDINSFDHISNYFKILSLIASELLNLFILILLCIIISKKINIAHGVAACISISFLVSLLGNVITILSITNDFHLNFFLFSLSVKSFPFLLFGLLLGIFASIIGTINLTISLYSRGSLIVGLILGLIYSISLGILDLFKTKDLRTSFLYVILILFCLFRIDEYCLNTIVNMFFLKSQKQYFSRVSILPFFNHTNILEIWLERDWKTALKNINQIQRYSLQFIPIIASIKKMLMSFSKENLIKRTSQFHDIIDDFGLIELITISRYSYLQKQFINEFCPSRWKNQIQNLWLRRNQHKYEDSVDSCLLGFWHLKKKESDRAAEAFAVVRNILYGEEMYILAETLHRFTQAETPKQIAQTQLLNFPRENLLRPNTWQALNTLRRVIEDTQLVQNSTSHTTRSLALNRAQGELKQILDTPENLPKAERELILDIARSWLDSLLNIASEIGEIKITQPVTIPYIIGDPVEGKNFIGREDIMRELESYWIHTAKPQSVVLYGHRRMGKTSILRNAAACCGANLRVVYVNLQILGHVTQGTGEVLMSITDELAAAFNLPHPADNDLLALPKRTFERYLKTIIPHLNDQNLIIALDEFEIVEELIEKGQIPPDFMGFLRGMVQLSPKIAFAFAGLHTLQEMTADYFQPFYASVIPVRVSFLQPAATRQILANPDEDFPLDYTGEALDRIHQLTHGQPYLVQRMGFSLVRRYNALVFEENRKLDPKFTVADVEAVIENPEFFQQGRYYFDGVWDQAKQDAPGQQDILRQLAPHPEGLPRETLVNALQFDEKMFANAIADLKRHDVVSETENGYKIMVELFRIWMVKHRRSRS